MATNFLSDLLLSLLLIHFFSSGKMLLLYFNFTLFFIFLLRNSHELDFDISKNILRILFFIFSDLLLGPTVSTHKNVTYFSFSGFFVYMISHKLT